MKMILLLTFLFANQALAYKVEDIVNKEDFIDIRANYDKDGYFDDLDMSREYCKVTFKNGKTIKVKKKCEDIHGK